MLGMFIFSTCIILRFTYHGNPEGSGIWIYVPGIVDELVEFEFSALILLFGIFKEAGTVFETRKKKNLRLMGFGRISFSL